MSVRDRRSFDQIMRDHEASVAATLPKKKTAGVSVDEDEPVITKTWLDRWSGTLMVVCSVILFLTLAIPSTRQAFLRSLEYAASSLSAVIQSPAIGSMGKSLVRTKVAFLRELLAQGQQAKFLSLCSGQVKMIEDTTPGICYAAYDGEPTVQEVLLVLYPTLQEAVGYTYVGAAIWNPKTDETLVYGPGELGLMPTMSKHRMKFDDVAAFQ